MKKNQFHEMVAKRTQKITTKRRIWFTADLHLGHTNILKFCPKTRKFTDVKEMNNKIISDWNTLVGEDDLVYVLGDVRFTKERLERQLNGEKHLILGNHDHTIKAEDWASVQHYKELNIEGKHVVMFHYPIDTWNRKHYGAIHLHGHGNNHERPDTPHAPNRLDVGLDATGRTLVSWDQVKELLK